jgi:hypothetical protein
VCQIGANACRPHSPGLRRNGAEPDHHTAGAAGE